MAKMVKSEESEISDKLGEVPCISIDTLSSCPTHNE